MSESSTDKIKSEHNPSTIGEATSVTQHVATVEGSVITGVVTGQVASTTIFGDERVSIKFPKRESVFYSVTESEIESYATFGLLSNISLTLFGLLAGFGLGCVAALAQGNIPEPGKTTLTWLIVFSVVTSLVFLVASLFLAYLQNTNKKFWRAKSTEETTS
jgi:uncharacterized BrkB/YihY/UPF0761 family membrane protein